jgi:hypothetical protein
MMEVCTVFRHSEFVFIEDYFGGFKTRHCANLNGYLLGTKSWQHQCIQITPQIQTPLKSKLISRGHVMVVAFER